MIEQLERRQLLAAAISDGILEITGTEGDDAYHIAIDHEALVLTQLGVSHRFDLDAVTIIRADLGAGADSFIMTGVPIPAFVFGGSGDDSIIGGAGRDTLIGGGGDDFIFGGRGADLMLGGRGSDTLLGGGGRDSLAGGDGRDSLLGGRGDDLLRGNIGHDTLRGLGGSDTLIGGGGNDRLAGGNDRDVLFGLRGNDTLRGGAGADALHGGDDDDVFYAEDGETGDTIAGGNGRDVAWYDVTTTGADLGSDIEERHPSPSFAFVTHEQFVEHLLSQPGVGLFGTTAETFSGTRFAVAYESIDASNAVAGSSTNTQERDVDEADLVETDGRYIYWLSTLQRTTLRVIDVATKQVVHATELQGVPEGMYLRGTQLTVVLRQYGQYNGIGDVYLCVIMPDELRVMTFDVADPEAPVLVREAEFDASLVSSRMTDSGLHLVLRQNPQLPWFEVNPLFTENYESREAYVSRVLGIAPEEVLGSYRTRTAGGEWVTHTLASEQIAGNLDTPYPSLLTVATITHDGAVQTASLIDGNAWSSFVYATSTSVYITTSVWIDGGRTDIQEVDLTDSGPVVSAAGSVPGRIVGQFAMDEYDGALRIATTEGGWSNPTNSLYILRQEGAALYTVGQLTGFGVNESIHGIRFTDDIAYIVTFQRTDPLHVIDLSDEANPGMLGELVIPGFSEYLHPISDTRVLGLGYDAFGRIELSLFDVSDRTNPTRLATSDLGLAEGYYSPALHDHHAFSYFSETGFVAIPANQYTGLTGGVVFVSVGEDSLTVHSTIDQPQAHRTVRVGEVVAMLGQTGVTFVSADAPDAAIATIQWATEQTETPLWL